MGVEVVGMEAVAGVAAGTVVTVVMATEVITVMGTATADIMGMAATTAAGIPRLPLESGSDTRPTDITAIRPTGMLTPLSPIRRTVIMWPNLTLRLSA